MLSFAYTYNNANQRRRASLADGSFWVYEYDALGQVRSGKRFWADSTPVAGQQFEYGHDDIGNRTSTKAGGDEMGANLRSAAYSAKSLNQYTARDVPAAFDVLGQALSTNAVTVNSQSTYRKGEYFRKEIPVSNTSTSVWQSVSVAASGETTVSGNVYVPKTQETFGYDLDGNLTNDGRWAYTWNAENRLIRLVANTSMGPQQRLDFEYDRQGRRIAKRVWNNISGTGNPTNDLKFVYDGWNLLAQLNATNNAVIQSYFWGSDLSGSIQGAGGVGGLLMIRDTASGVYVPAFDGNGNVSGLVAGPSGSVGANYDYDSFGAVLRSGGVAAVINPIRFSSKYQDDETDFLYYGYRYLYAVAGRWLSRDPAEELSLDINNVNSSSPSGLNCYGFVLNAPTSTYDYLGLEPICGCKCGPETALAIYITMLNVKTIFLASDTRLQKAACRGLQTLLGTGAATDSWDINSLVNWSWFSSNPSCNSQCKDTVTYKGHCFYAGHVNYIMYGYACSLCKFSRAKSHNWMEQKLWLRTGWPVKSGDTRATIGQKLEFVDEGYYISLMRQVAVIDSPSCVASRQWVPITHPGRLGTFDTFDWIWEPLKNRTH